MPSTLLRKPAKVQPSHIERDHLLALFHQAAQEIAQYGVQPAGNNGPHTVAQTAAYRQAQALGRQYPRHGFAWKVLGALLLQQNRWSESAAASQRAAALAPDDASVYNNLGAAQFGLQQIPEALASYRKALAIAPGYAKAHLNLARILQQRHDLVGAEKHCRMALQSEPHLAAAHAQLGNVLELQNHITAAIASYTTALRLEPGSPGLHSDMLHLMSHDVHTDAMENLLAHKRFSEIFEVPLQAGLQPHVPPAGGQIGTKLKVGFACSDLNDHAMANYLEPLLRLLSQRPSLEVHVYYSNPQEDFITQRIKSSVIHWHDVTVIDDRELAGRIRQDGIGILIDTNGHTVRNRLLAFARKPAPVQMSWLGYLGTTGLKAMDYYISDTTAIPPGELDWQFVEKLAWLPCAAVFQPHANAPAVNSLPALQNGYITFGSFNRHNKINDAVLSLWAMLLQRIPNARLLLCGIVSQHQEPILRGLKERGIDSERLTIYERVAQVDFLALHHKVDFCLDTFPFCGGATLAHSAWMGVPTLTLAGELPASRLGAAEMHHLGLPGFVATSIEDYLEKGLHWATHHGELAALRGTLRQRFALSPLGDTVAFANAFEALLHKAWQHWCEGMPRESLRIESTAPLLEGTPLAIPENRHPDPTQQELEALISLHAQQDYAQLLTLAQRLTDDYPEHGAARKYLGSALHHLGRLDEALALQKSTAALRPNDYEAHFNLAAELQHQGQLDEAVQSYLQALSLQPNNPTAYNNLGNIFKVMGLFKEAESYFRQALDLKPDMVIAMNNLGTALHAQGKFTEAEYWLKKALDMKPLWAEAWNNLAICLKDQGYSSEARDAFRKALSIKDDWSAAHSNLLFSLSLDVQTDPQTLYEEHLAYGAAFEPRYLPQRLPHNNSKDIGRPLNIGFVSGDLFDHALANFLEPVFAGLSTKADLLLHAYYTHIYDDSTTKRLRTYFHSWSEVANLGADVLAERIRADGIDILFDLSGHTAHNRLLTFARKPAPIQVSYLGYLGTTGMQCMDYYLCDPFWLPPQKTEWQFTEKMAWLPGAVVFQPHPLAPEVNALPALTNGYITLGSFNRPNKLNDSVIALWSMLLHAVPNARMVLGGVVAERQEEIFRRFITQGIDINRITFFPRSNIVEYLALHHHVDFCLDTFPYGGGATNAWAAWMGVPTLCLAGETPASRFGASEMFGLGLGDFVADSIENFVAKGRHWAAQTDALAALRAGMRERFAASSLGNVPAFADHLHSMLRSMWKRWCDGTPPDHIDLRTPATAMTKHLHTALPVELQNQLADLYERGATQQAMEFAQRLSMEYPHHSLSWQVMAQLQQQQGRFADALETIQQALLAEPENATLWNNLGVIHQELGQLPQADTAFSKAIHLQPDYGRALVNSANVAHRQGQFEMSCTLAQRALDINDRDANAWAQLGNALEAMGKASQAQICYYKADMAFENRRAVAHSNVLYLMNHDVLIEPHDLWTEHLAYGVQFEAACIPNHRPHTNGKVPDRKLKLGFVSGDFCQHAMSGFLEPACKALAARPGLELHAYDCGSLVDATHQRFRTHIEHWHRVSDLSDEALAAQIVLDGIDILVDLSGHTAKNRLGVFARKPAPLQVGWVGYLGTSGMQSMDYYLCDAHWIPKDGFDWQFTEKLVHLPGAVVFAHEHATPDVNPLPALSHGYLTFGSFNRIGKINESVVALWSMLLQRLPSARLQLVGITENDQQMLTQQFAGCGVAESRLTFLRRLASADYLAAHHQVDICLDTFPYGGGATTAHAAWMGVPTLCLAGTTPASRFGAGLMHQLGLSEYVGESIEAFVEAGLRLASDLSGLEQTRSGMRKRFVQSPLGQPHSFAGHLERAFRCMWQRWCAGEGPASLQVTNETPELPGQERVVVVSATRLPEAAFWTHSALGQSLRTHMAMDSRLVASVRFNNKEGLAEVFNAAIAGSQDHDTLVFVHDDVWLDEAYFVDAVIAGVDTFDVIGLAGTTRKFPNQVHWRAGNADLTSLSTLYSSGRLAHGPIAHSTSSYYGPVAQPCQLMDGVFFAARRSTLVQSNTRFDPQFDFHCYDLDFCRSATRAGLVLGTWPIAVSHQGGGGSTGTDRKQRAAAYLSKWEQPDSKTAPEFDSPLDATTCSKLVFGMANEPTTEPRSLAQEQRLFGLVYEPLVQAQRFNRYENSTNPNKRLKIGFVCSTAATHAWSDQVRPALRELARDGTTECFVYDASPSCTSAPTESGVTWQQVTHWSDEAIARHIHQDGIDILVDLSGHSENSRLLVFAMKPAPVQVSWAGQTGSSGLRSMDYLLCDTASLVQSTQTLFTERLSYLPVATVFEPSHPLAEISALPALAHAFLTVGCFVQHQQTIREMSAVWIRLLNEVPGTHLVLVGISDEDQPRIFEFFAQSGISSARVRMYTTLSMPSWLGLLDTLDICISDLPPAGVQTTAYAMCMGVPTIACTPKTTGQRFHAAMIRNAGLADFLVDNVGQVIQKCAHWLSNLGELSTIRMSLRNRFLSSPAASGHEVAHQLALGLRIMWKRWCASQNGTDLAASTASSTTPAKQAYTPFVNRVRLFGPVKRPYYIYTPPYRNTSGGIRAMHYMCHALNLAGEEAYVTTPEISSRLRTPVLTNSTIDMHTKSGREPIVVYPEVVDANPLNAQHVVRYFLNVPGHLNSKPIRWKDSDLLFSHGLDIIPQNTQAQLLQIPLIDRSVYKNQKSTTRQGSLVFINRYLQRGGTLLPITEGATEISFRVEHRTPEQLSELYNKAEVMYTYEQSTACYEAMLCGCPVVYLPNPVMLPKEPICHLGRGGWAWGATDDQLTWAKTTVHQVDTTYNELEAFFWDELELFISLTQAHATHDRSSVTNVAYLPQENQLEIGIRLYDQGDLDNATLHLLDVINREPLDPIPAVYLSLVCAAKGLVSDASTLIEQAVGLAPNRPDFYAALGEAFLKAGNAVQACFYIEKALNIDPKMMNAYPAWAQSLHLAGNTQKAIAFLKKVLAESQSGHNAGLQALLSQIQASLEVQAGR